MYKYGKEMVQRISDKFNEIKDKESYLKFRETWAKEYMILSAKIRTLKHNRKEYIWQYRKKGDNTSKRRTKIRANPNYDSMASYNAYILRIYANDMMCILENAKKRSYELKKKQLLTTE